MTDFVINPLALEICVALVKVREGCKLTAYQDIVGVWTIGYGETLGVYQGLVWTQEQADTALKTRLAGFMDRVVAACPSLGQNGASNRLAACTSLAYNIGSVAFAGSTVARMVNQGNLQAAADAFLLWNKAGGKVVQGLVNRRQIERTLFLKPE